ncbi:MAG TPA: phosphatase PAP2 family protein [Sphingomicrobium sp.]|nr:phosphatase PAP2 family protein [Sphingomicrobium sp.]
MTEKTDGRRDRWRVAIGAAVLALLWLAMLMVGAGPVDGRLLAAFYAGDRAAIAGVASVLTFFGDGPTLILIAVAAAAWMLWRGLPRHGLAIIAVTLLGRSLVDLQKYGIGRLRPEELDHLVPVSSASFPSAHAANSMIVYLTIALVLTAGLPRSRLAAGGAIALSLLVGLSRVILGVHYPSDVVGGWAFGLLWVLLALPLAERLAR